MSFTTRRLTSKSSQYKIPNSLRFRSSASAYLSRTPAVAGNRTTWTWSGWVKIGTTSQISLFGTYGYPNSWYSTFISINSSVLTVFSGIAENNYTIRIQPTTLLRDYSSWYHIVVSIDTTQATASNRVKIYINGAQETSFINNIQPTQNFNTNVNGSILHTQGAWLYASSASYGDCYLTEVNFIDGQALDPLAFGRIDSKTGVWTPSKYTGTYGTNGFYLKFTDTSSNTATGIGKDFSGNGNNWTPNNISLTAGATYDSMIDTPTPYDDGGYGRGNYCTISPSYEVVNGSGLTVNTLTDGNLSVSMQGAYPWPILTRSLSISPNKGKWYCEWRRTAQYLNYPDIWIGNALQWANGTYGGSLSHNAPLNVTGAVAFDLDNMFYRSFDGTSWSSNVSLVGIDFTKFLLNVVVHSYSSLVAADFNFGQRPFAYTPPTGFKGLCTQNLPTPAIINPAQFMAATTYAGTGATQTIANTVNSRSFQPDLVWIKGRSAATDHALYDSVRGATKDLVSNSTAAETTQATGLTTFGSNGFTVGSLAKLNTSAQTYVAWQWKAGDSTVTNTAGTITSQVDANPTAGFSIVSYTGTGTSNPTIGHGLGVVPAMIICKNRDTATSAANDWFVYHKDAGAGYLMLLNKTDARATISGSTQGAIGTSPSTSTFTIAAGSIGSLNLNESGDRHIAYCFAEVEGFSKFGSYTGNGSADGPFVYCGFRPRWIMTKRTDNAFGGDWYIHDTQRDKYNVLNALLYANGAATEGISNNSFDIVSNGFKVRNASTNYNASGSPYIFAAFAEAPFKYALAR